MTGPFSVPSGRTTLPGLRFEIHGRETTTVTAEQVALFLFDFSLAFEVYRLLEGSDQHARLTKWHLYRGHRRVAAEERLVVTTLRMNSPIEVVATTAAASAASIAAVWGAVQVLERVCMFRLNRRRAMLEVRKLALEVQRLEMESIGCVRVGSSVGDRGPVLLDNSEYGAPHHPVDETERVLETLSRRIERSPLKVAELDVEFDPEVRSVAG